MGKIVQVPVEGTALGTTDLCWGASSSCCTPGANCPPVCGNNCVPRTGQGVTLEQGHISGASPTQAEKGVLVILTPVGLLKSKQCLGCAQRALRMQTWG